MASNPSRMHQLDPAMLELILNYVTERLELVETPVDGLGDREAMQKAMTDLISDDPRDAREVLDVYIDHLADTVLSADSPRFYAFIPAAPTKASLLFDMVVSASSLQGCSWLEAAGAVMAENSALEVMAKAAGIPPSAGGTFVSGGSAGNLSALVVARDMARRSGAAVGSEKVIVSDQSHSSITNALNITGMTPVIVPTVDGRMDRAAIDAALAADPDAGSGVVAIVATAGTTNAGIVDDLAAAADVARERDLWFHVDGAYGGAGLLVPEVRHLYSGIERADSLVMDPHKWWFAPFDSAALLYRDPRLAKSVHTQDASYLDVIHDDDADDLNPSDLAYHLTRRARGMALWFSMAVNGLDAYRDAVKAGIDIASYSAAKIEEHPHLELVRRPDLSIVLFRRNGWGLTDYERWSQQLLQQQVAFVTPSAWSGEPVGRLAFLHPSTTHEMVDEVLATL
ncbi:aminotransferase class I/II-fold pyridoxal phosphate-dependent enzyme [Candidatus Nanopelagicales bacterium]|nr:aminotransferase class I/II-fold pyridoxal phosphate-dependent enzyme [Candidatus Nanopelagicales bacterium]